MKNWWQTLGQAGVVAVCLATVAVGQVKVEKAPADVGTRQFDPKNRPTEMPPLRGNEAAVTESNFGISAGVEVTITDQRPKDGQWVAKAEVTGVTVALRLQIIEWLPNGVTPKIRAHEAGHRKISEMFYQDAEKKAEALARPWLGKTLTGTGKDAESAAKKAMDQAMQQLNGQYMAAVNAPSVRVQTLYDQLTDHGRNDLEEAKAIEQAMEKAGGAGDAARRD